MPVLTQEDIAKCRRAFKTIDHNNDGSIQVYELRHQIEKLCSPQQVDAIIEVADADRSGRIDFAEFLRISQVAIPDENGQADGNECHSTPALKDLLPDEFNGDSGVDRGRSTAVLEDAETPSQKLKKPRCCFIIPLIHPEGLFANLWNVISALAIVYAALMTPVLLAFQDQFYGESKKQVLMVDTGVNCIFILDICINFISMYNDGNNDLVTDTKKIACRYLSTWFIPDVVSCIPLDLLLGSGGDEKGLLYAKLARMGKLARVLRLLKILKILKLLRLLKFMTKFDALFQKVLTNDKYDGEGSKGYQFMKFCICALLVAHVAGCLWYALAKFHEDIDDTWIVSRGIEEADILDQYLHSMYFIITTLTTVGYGDISASTNAEIVVAILLMMGGVLGYSISVGTVSTVLMQEDQRQTVITNKMQTLAHFAKDTNMDLREYGKIRRHIKRKYTESLDWMEHLTGPAQLQSLLNDLPVVLRSKMLRHMHHGRHLNLEFFSKYRDDDLFAYIVPLLSSAQFDAKDMIYLKGDYAERMYFLTKGTVVFFTFAAMETEDPVTGAVKANSQRQMMDKKDYDELEQSMVTAEPFQVVVDGSTFGDFELLLGIPRQLCVRADIQCECLAYHKKDLLRTLAEFPLVAESMRQDAQQEYHATMKRKRKWSRDKGLETQKGDELYDEYGETPVLNHAIPKAPKPEDHHKIPGEKPEIPRIPIGDAIVPFSSLLTSGAKPVRDRSPAASRPPLASPRSGGSHETLALAHRFQHVEDRLEFIEMKQESIIRQAAEAKEQQDQMAKHVQDMQTTLFSIDLRIQSLVLRQN